MDVGDVDLDAGDPDRLERVQDGIAIVGKGAGIHDDSVIVALRGMNGVNDGSLVVGLEALGSTLMGGGKGAQAAAEGGVVLLAIDAGLALAQQVQIGAVDDEKFHDNPSRMALTVASGDEKSVTI